VAKRNAAELTAGAVVLVVAIGFLVYAVAHTGRSAGAGDTFHATFERIDGLFAGADVRIAGVKVGSVLSSRLDPKTFQATVDFTVASGIGLPKDTAAAISSDGLLGSEYLSLLPGGDDATIPPGGAITVTQSAINIEELLGKFIFSAANLASSTRSDGQGAKPDSAQGKPAAGSGELPPLGGQK
jgi:phospholipid/cholesterol/gamma-HCH transport system substrate-binding protein